MKSKQVVMSILALLICTLSGYNEMNTRIGWPWTYCAHGVWPVIGFLLVGGLVLLGISVVFASSNGDDLGIRIATLFVGLCHRVPTGLPSYEGWRS